MFWFSKIGKMVMSIISKKIKEAQAEYNLRCKDLEAQHADDIRKLAEVKETHKVEHAQKLVEQIVGKII